MGDPIERINYLETVITKLNKLHQRLSRELIELRENQCKSCHHHWQIDTSYVDEHTVYKCTKCGLID